MLNQTLRPLSLLGSGGGGGSFAPDGTLPVYASMTALAAGIANVGEAAQLVGATTGELILTAYRVAAGANGLITVGEWDLRQADGGEFGGLFAPAAADTTAPTVAWGTAGASGGLALSGGGYLKWPGWFSFGGRLSCKVEAQVYFEAVTVTPSNYDGALVGIYSEESHFVSGGGALYTGSTAFRTAKANRAADSTLNSATTGSTFVPSEDHTWNIGMWRHSYGSTAASEGGMTARIDPSPVSTAPARTSGTLSGSNDATQMPMIYSLGLTTRFQKLYPSWGL